MSARDLPDTNLIEALRRAAATWFKNSDLLLLEELIRRYRRLGSHPDESQRNSKRD